MVVINAGNGMFAALYCAIFCKSSFCKLKFFSTSITSLDPETFKVLTFYILSTMITGVRGLPEKLSFTLVPLLGHSVHVALEIIQMIIIFYQYI